MDELLSWIRSATFAVRWLALRFDSIESIDCAGAQMLMELAERMRNQGVTLVFAELTRELKSFLSDFGVLTTIGVDRFSRLSTPRWQPATCLGRSGSVPMPDFEEVWRVGNSPRNSR